MEFFRALTDNKGGDIDNAPADIVSEISFNEKRTVFVIVSILLSAILYFYLVAPQVILYSGAHDNTKSLIEEAGQISYLNPAEFNPKVLEKRLFYTGILFFAVSITAFLLLLTWAFNNIKYLSQNIKISYYVFTAALIAAVFVWSAVFLQKKDSYMVNPTLINYFDFYFQDSIVKIIKSWYLGIAVLLTALMIYFKKSPNKFFEGCYKYSIDIIVGIVIIYVFKNSIFDYPLMSGLAHFNALYYSQTQVNDGVQLMTNGFTNNYGLYPYYLAPIMNITGKTIFNFTVIMAALNAACFIMVYISFRKIIRSKTLLLLGMLSFIYMGYIFGKVISHDYYFQYHPLRIIFPCLSIYLASCIAIDKSKIAYYLSFFILPHALLWNPDSGAVVNIAWIMFIVYNEIDLNSIKQSLTGICKSLSLYAAGFFISIFLFQVIIKTVYGSYIDIPAMFSTINIFSKYGYYLLDMPKLHLWNLYMAISFGGLAYAVLRIYEKEATDTAKFIFYYSVLMIGLFIYYQGRSHTYTFTAIQGYMFLPITMFADYLLHSIRKHYAAGIKGPIKYAVEFMLLAMCLSMICFSILSTARHVIYNDKYFEKDNNEKAFVNTGTKSIIQKSAAIINKYVKPGEKLLILSINYQSCLYSETKTISCFNPGIVELFYYSDLKRLKDSLKKSEFPYIYMKRTMIKSGYCLGVVDYNIYKIIDGVDDFILLKRTRL